MKTNRITKNRKALAVAAAALVAAGCASAPKGVQEAYAEWKDDRAPTEQVVSKSSDKKIADIINGVAVIPGEVYAYVAQGADEAMARNAGRAIYQAIVRDRDAGTPMEEIRAHVSDADWAAAIAYQNTIKDMDFDALKEKLSGISAKLATDGAKVGQALAQIKELDSMKSMDYFSMATALREPAAEIDVISAQVSDAVQAVQFWMDLNEQDEKFKRYAQEAPVE